MNPTAYPQQQKGLTLVELMISIAIGATIMAGVVQFYASSISNRLAFEGHARIQENARFVFSQMEQDILQSGSGGCMGLVNASNLNRIVNALGYASTDHQHYDMKHFVRGAEQSGTELSDTLSIRLTDRGAAIPVIGYAESDRTITLDTQHEAYNNLSQYQIVYAANCSRMAALMITNSPTDTGVIEYKANITAPANSPNPSQFNTAGELALGSQFASGNSNTHIASSSLSYVYGGDSIATYRVGNSANGTCSSTSPQHCVLLRNDEEIAEGVESFDVEYGWEAPADEMRFGNWDQVLSNNTAKQIDRIKITATFNTIDRSPNVDGGDYVKKTISRIFNLRNQLPTY